MKFALSSQNESGEIAPVPVILGIVVAAVGIAAGAILHSHSGPGQVRLTTASNSVAVTSTTAPFVTTSVKPQGTVVTFCAAVQQWSDDAQAQEVTTDGSNYQMRNPQDYATMTQRDLNKVATASPAAIAGTASQLAALYPQIVSNGAVTPNVKASPQTSQYLLQLLGTLTDYTSTNCGDSVDVPDL